MQGIRRLSVLVVVAALSGWPGVSWANGWEASFVPAAVASHLGGDAVRVMVVPAGSDVPAHDAAQALRTALTTSGRASLVMDASPLGDVAALSDGDIVAKASKMPLDLVIVVRLFGTGAASNAVVTLYDLAGSAVGAFSARPGEPVAASRDVGTKASAGEGISNDAVEAVREKSRTVKMSLEEAKDAYAKRTIYFADWVGVNQHGAVVATWSVPYRGKFREPLEGGAFYDAIGQPDLASSYRTRAGWKVGLAITQWAGYLGGIGLTTYALLDSVGTIDDQGNITDDCLTCHGAFYPGLALLGVGFTAMIANAFIDLHPVPFHDARRMVDDYNRELARELGLSEVPDPPSSGLLDDRERGVDLTIAPAGLGVQVLGRF